MSTGTPQTPKPNGQWGVPPEVPLKPTRPSDKPRSPTYRRVLWTLVVVAVLIAILILVLST